jgi:hypothetical protein
VGRSSTIRMRIESCIGALIPWSRAITQTDRQHVLESRKARGISGTTSQHSPFRGNAK